MKKLILPVSTVLLLFSATGASAQAGEEIVDGALDWIRLAADPPSGEQTVVILPFDASEADFGTGGKGGKPKRTEAVETIQTEGPGRLARSLVEKLSKLGTFQRVDRADDAAKAKADILVEGRFTILDPGNRAKRYMVGFGAGKGRTEIEGTVKTASGEVLAEFRHKRLVVMGAGGGNYVRKMRADCERFGEDIAEFLDAWVKGKNLR